MGGNNINFNNEVNCQTCKHGYFKTISWDGNHNWCGADMCYLCSEEYQYCDSYEMGDVPEGKDRLSVFI